MTLIGPTTIAQSLKMGYRTSVRNRSSTEDFAKIIQMANLWKRCPIRHQVVLPNDQKPFRITRSDRTVGDLSDNLCIRRGFTSCMLTQGEQPLLQRIGLWGRWFNTHCFAVALKMEEQKAEFLESGKSVFFEILRAVAERDFDGLAPFTLGKNTLQFHRKRAWNLTELQREALRMTEDDLIGSNGYLLRDNGFENDKDGLGRYIHKLSFVQLDATDETPENKDDVYIRYTVTLGALRKQSELFSMIRSFPFTGGREMRVKMPNGYKFQSPRYTFVDLEVCQKVIKPITFPLKLVQERKIYDFHIYSF